MESDEDENKIIRNIGSVIRELRLKEELSQFNLSIQIGISENQLSRIERGESNPTVRTLYKISKALGVDLKTLVDS